MALKNKSMYAILGILNLLPSTGYDIKKYSDTVLSGFWNENYGHIYPTLKKLVDEEMIEIVSNEGNEKKVLYQITEKGKFALASWLAEDTELQPVRSEFMLKFLFSSSQSKENTITMLENYKNIHERTLEKYIQMQSDVSQGIREITEERVFFLNAVLRSGILSNEAVIRWCDETIPLLSSKPSR